MPAEGENLPRKSRLPATQKGVDHPVHGTDPGFPVGPISRSTDGFCGHGANRDPPRFELPGGRTGKTIKKIPYGRFAGEKNKVYPAVQ